MSLRERWREEDKSDHETTLRELAEKLMHQSASSGAHGLSVPVVARGVEEAAACLAGADALAAPPAAGEAAREIEAYRAGVLAGEPFCAPPAAGAPPALVALVQRAQKAFKASQSSTTGHTLGDWTDALADLLAWSPAPAPVAVVGVDWASGPDRSVEVPAPVAPPAETKEEQNNMGAVAQSGRALGAPRSSLNGQRVDVGSNPTGPHLSPAPPAVAGGDAPEEGLRCTCPVRPCGACDYDPPRQLRSVSDGPYLKGQAPRRRRQEGQ